MSLGQLSWYVGNTVGGRLLGQQGVAAVTREGGLDRQIRIILNPAALMAHGITAAQVNAQLRQTNLNATGGRAEIAGSEQSVRILGNAATAYDLSQHQISVSGGRVVRLAELATFRTASETRSPRCSATAGVSFKSPRQGESDLVVTTPSREMRKIEKDDRASSSSKSTTASNI